MIWQLIWVLTSCPFMTLSNHRRNEDKSTNFDFDINFIIEPLSIEKFVMHPLMLLCALYKSFDIEPLSLTLHGYTVSTCFIHQPSPKEKVKILNLMSIFQRVVNCQKFEICFLDSLMCPRQIINNIEPLTLTLHGVNAHFIHHPSKWRITWSAISHQPVNPPKMLHRVIYFYTFVQIFESKFKIPSATEIQHFFKIQNRLSKAPWATPTDCFFIQYLNNKYTLAFVKVSKILDFRQPMVPH